MDLYIKPGEDGYYSKYDSILKKIGNISDIKIVNEDVTNCASFMVGSSTFFIPLVINKEEEFNKIKMELEYTIGFLDSVMNKTGNEKFMKNAPSHVVELEKKKQFDAEEKIKILEKRLELLIIPRV